MIGKTLSHYKVLEKIGQGGMGEVYRAEDTNLSREVAIKVLPEQFIQDPQRLARFEREAKLLAQLNHPNIAAIYGLEEADGVRFLALELVPGETLQERVAKGPLPVEEALEVCRQIAEGVEAAHEKGVIHRDLKPANVKVTPEGKVKILDFGLAKAFETEPPVTDISQSPTLTEEMTRAGVILGTAAYMSPEQAKGKPVDKRADVFAFGAILYELLTGRRAFEGETITETIAAVLKSEPDWGKLPQSAPWRIRELLAGCLEKDTHDRLHDVANVRIQIRKAVAEPTTLPPVGVAGTIQPPLWRRTIPWSITAVVIVIAGFSIWSLSRPTPQPLLKLDIVPLSTAPLANLSDTDLAISPDGKRIVYVAENEGTTQLYVRSLDELIATPIPGTEGVDGNPFFSPDGRSLAFEADGSLKRVSISGGTVITLSELPNIRGGSWEPDDTILFSAISDNDNALYRVSAAGGEPEMLAVSSPGEGTFHNPMLLANGKDLLFHTVLNQRREIRVLSLETGDLRIVGEGRHPHYLPTGHLIYELFLTGTLMAVPFDLTSLEGSGQAVPVVEGVRTNSPGDVDYDISENGTLTYVSGSVNPERTLVWVDREGRTESVIQRRFNQLQLSPAGKRVAITVGFDVWVYEIDRGILTSLTFGDRQYRAPIWTPGGERLTFTGGSGEGIFWIPADGSGEVEQLTVTESKNTQIPGSWSPDNVLVYSEGLSPRGIGDIWVLAPEGDRKPQEFLVGAFNERHPMFSPDGRWIAFTSDRSGQDEIYVTAYPDKGGVVQISTNGGTQPLWSRSGKELFYRNGDKLMAVSVQTGTALKAETPVLLFEGTYYHGPFNRTSNYDISLDGQRFLMIKEEREVDQIHVVLNWFEELKRLVPTP